MMMNSMERSDISSSRSRSRPRSSLLAGEPYEHPVGTILETPLDGYDGDDNEEANRMPGEEEDGEEEQDANSPGRTTAVAGPFLYDDDFGGGDDEDDQVMPMMLPIHYGHQQEVGIYGWRKKLVYILLAAIVFLVLINLFLALWIISILGVSSTGIRGIDLSSEEDQITIKGTAIFSKRLFATEVASLDEDEHRRQPLRFTAKNADLTFRSWWTSADNQTDGGADASSTRLILSRNKIVLYTDKFEVRDRKDRLMFALDSLSSSDNIRQLTLHTNSLKVENKNSLTLPVALQTGLVDHHSESANEPFRIFSPQSRLVLRGPKAVHLESKLGPGSMVTFGELALRSNGGAVTFEGHSAVYMRQLRLVEPTTTATGGHHSRDELMPRPDIYQVCICNQTGKLFMAPADSRCAIRSYRDCR